MQSPPTPVGGTPQSAGAVRSEMREDAKRVGNSAANRIHSELDSRKGTAANQAKSVSSAIDRAAGELDDSAPQWLKSAFQQGADQVRRLADTLEQKDSRQIVDDVRNLARDNPGAFLAGCAALGFAAARIFKAGEQTNSAQPTGGYEPMPEQHFAGDEGDQPVFRSWGNDSASSHVGTNSGGLA